ncbi:HET-domain-containing protein [Cladorrhinum sp. PSN332]|nr:HET-domain-containing protein [Cladorrhinum sp. PSN332]
MMLPRKGVSALAPTLSACARTILLVITTLAEYFYVLFPPAGCLKLFIAFILANLIVIILALGLILFATLELPSVIEHAVYVLSTGRFVIRVPRLAMFNSFQRTRLCEHCHVALRKVPLLFGSWSMFARTSEQRELYPTMEEMRYHWSDCMLCETLLSVQDDAEYSSRSSRWNYDLDEKPAILDIKLLDDNSTAAAETRNSVVNLSLGTLDGVKFNSARISQGPYQDPAPDVQVSTGSDATLKEISRWIEDCSQNHPACVPSSKVDLPFVPSRLVFVGSYEEPQLRIITRSGMGAPPYPAYTALSHCWGGNILCRLTEDNYAAMSDSIPEESLPKNFVDAVNITRRLGKSHIWIDSLCIVQGSATDWEKEAPTMCQVYANAYCTIASTASENSHGGCIRDRPLPQPERNLLTSKSWRYYMPTSAPPVKTLFDTRVETAPLTRRAWAFQERLLSRRILHFCTDVVLFECNTIRRSEFHSDGARYEEEPYFIQDGKLSDWFQHFSLGGKDDARMVRARAGIRGSVDVLPMIGSSWTLPDSLAERIEISQRWFDIVSAYTEGALTVPTDKLVALSGVAELIEEGLRAPYVAGLWDIGNLELQLLWKVRKSVTRQSEYCAPSWSWASSTGRIKLAYERIDITQLRTANLKVSFAAKVNNVVVSWKGQPVIRANSQVDFGSLTITGPATRGSLRHYGSHTFLINGAALERRGSGTPRLSLPITKDWDFVGESELSLQSVMALHVMTIHQANQKDTFYGIVLRQRRKRDYSWDHVYERIGSFKFQGEALPNPNRWKEMEQIVVE